MKTKANPLTQVSWEEIVKTQRQVNCSWSDDLRTQNILDKNARNCISSEMENDLNNSMKTNSTT